MNNKNNIIREKYLNKIKPFIGKNLIKVLTGQRRVGKSFIMMQVIDYIKNIDKNSKIIYINRELIEFDYIKDYEVLNNYIYSKIDSKKNNYLFIDEIQEVTGFEKCLRSIIAKNDADIYITGSNADMLSSDLATILSGRYIEVKVYGLSYIEYLVFHKLENNKNSLEKYMKYGGLPGLINLSNNDYVWTDYLKGIYSTILFKDVISRYKIRNVSFLENLSKYIADNLGSIVSAKKISDFLKSQKVSVSTNLVLDYLGYLTKAYFTYKANRIDVNGKKIFEIGEKYYFEDLGLRNILVGYKKQDINKVIENVVFLHLKMLDYTVYVGWDKEKEIDFICEKDSEKLYIQVTYLLADDNVINREFGNLTAINDNYPKYVISMDEFTINNTFKGIKHLNLVDFLTSEVFL